LATSSPETETSVLNRYAWTLLSGAIALIAALIAKQAAKSVWKLATGDEPPKKK
jgi:Protein of unknown function (DUF4235)